MPLTAGLPLQVETLGRPAMDQALAWQTRRIAFDHQSLAEVLAQFQRFPDGGPARRVTISDPRLSALRVTGRVRADDLEGLLEVLAASFNVAVDRQPDGEIVLRLR